MAISVLQLAEGEGGGAGGGGLGVGAEGGGVRKCTPGHKKQYCTIIRKFKHLVKTGYFSFI